MDADQFADPASRRCPRIGSRFDRTDIATNKYRYVPGADVFLADKLDVSGLDHSIRSFDSTDKALSLDHSERF
jgi:hypothetical protein